MCFESAAADSKTFKTSLASRANTSPCEARGRLAAGMATGHVLFEEYPAAELRGDENTGRGSGNEKKTAFLFIRFCEAKIRM